MMTSIYTIWADAMTPKKYKAKKEIKYPGKTVYIPELRMSVKVREGTTLKQWIINYCRSTPIAKNRLYAAYGIVE